MEWLNGEGVVIYVFRGDKCGERVRLKKDEEHSGVQCK